MRACRLSTLVSRRALFAPLSSLTASRRWQSEGAKPDAEAAAEKPAEGAEKPKADAALEEKVAKLEELLKDKTAEAKELKDKVLYAVAEAENARRIAKLDIDKAKDFSVTSIAKDMLEVSDTLQRAVDAFTKLDKETSDKLASVLTGVKMSHNVLLHNLGRHGVEKMKVEKGSKFDPNHHEALFKAPATEEIPADSVAAVVKEGYMLKNRVLRAAQVGVAEKQ